MEQYVTKKEYDDMCLWFGGKFTEMQSQINALESN